MLEKIKDPVSCLTHLAGAFLALICTVVLLLRSVGLDDVYMISFSIFGATLIMLYSASAVYHMLKTSQEKTRLLRRIDHTMIFFLIAGTYTPACLIPLRGPWGWSILCVVWGLALVGTFMKIFWLQAPRYLSTTIYVVMGWIVIIAFFPLLQAISPGTFMLLLAGGLAYTAGALIYALKWPPLHLKGVGFHEIFHIFVLLGSAFHVAFMFRLFPA